MAISDLQRYEMILKSHEASTGTHNPGALGLDGWRKCSKAELRRLYHAGKISVTQAVRLGFPTLTDHGKRLGLCRDVEEITRVVKEMIAAGVEISRVNMRR
jgi:hypothetical protein